MKKNYLLFAVFALLAAAYILAAQPWFLVTMSPNQDEVVLRSFDGLTVSPSTSALLLVSFAGIASALLTKGIARSISFSVSAASQFLSVALGAALISSKDLSAVANEIEAATGIAANHGLKDLAIAIQPVAIASLVIFLLLGAVLGFTAVLSRGWQKSRVPVSMPKATRPKDPISLWDQQR